MSAKCQKQTFHNSFDQLVGAREQRRWNGEAERQFGVVVFDWVGGDGSTMSALLKRSTVRELDLQPLNGQKSVHWYEKNSAQIFNLLPKPFFRLLHRTPDF